MAWSRFQAGRDAGTMTASKGSLAPALHCSVRLTRPRWVASCLMGSMASFISDAAS